MITKSNRMNPFLQKILATLQSYRIQNSPERTNPSIKNGSAGPSFPVKALAAYGAFHLLRPKVEKPAVAKAPEIPQEPKKTNGSLFSGGSKPSVFSGTSGRNVSDMMNVVDHGGIVQVDKPTSARFYTGEKPADIKSSRYADEYYGAKRTNIASTCVKSVRYNPETHKCYLTYVGSDKEYSFVMPPEAFEDFMQATSKGMHQNYILKVYYRDPAYNQKKK